MTFTNSGSLATLNAGPRTLTLTGASTGANSFASVIVDQAAVTGLTNLVKSGAGTWTLSGANSYTGVTTLAAGMLSVATIGNGGVSGNLGTATNAAANLVFDGGTLQYTGGTASTDRNFTINAGKTATVDVTVAANTLTISGAAAATNGALTKIGDGTLALSGTNLYTGTTTIAAGILNANASAALGDGSATNALVFTGGTLQAGGTITSPATRPVTATSTALIDTNGQAVSVAGIISGAGGLTKSGAGTLSLSGVNDYTGVTTLGAGTLSVGTIGNGGVSGNLARPPALPLTWCLTAARCNTPAVRPVPTATSRFSASKTATVDVSTAASTLTISGAAAATNGALTKIGAGTLALGGTNLYTGATAVNDGTLLVNGSITSDTTVTSPATLGGTGTITGNVSGTGTVAPGASIETLQISGNYTPGGPTLIELQDPYTTAGTHYDQLIVSGTVNLGGGTLTLIASGAAAAAGTQMTIIDNTGSGAVTPFSGLADGATVSNGSYTGRISYFGGDGNDVVLSTLNTAASVVIGTASADTFQIRRVGSTIQVLLGGSVVFAAPLASLNSLQIDGGDGNDTLTINYVDDANSDGFFNLPITFNGQGPTTSPGDKLVISGGTFNTVTPNHTNANDGDINRGWHGHHLHRPRTGRYHGHDHHQSGRQPDRHQ